MTTVNWEREPGEKIEEFVAAMLLLDHPHGNRITPSRGDRGVDIRVQNSDGYDIYQVKRYSRPLTPKQAADVEASWSRFVTETLAVLPVRSWTLVMPWDPSNQRLEWLERLTSAAGIPVHWMGRATLDGMAARHPSLVAYYFGDGGHQLQRLLAQAFQGGRDLPEGAAPDDLLEAVAARHHGLAAALSDLDPFYRYEFEVRTGQVQDQPWDGDLHAAAPIAFLRYRQLDDRHYLVMRLVARSSESLSLRPITASLELQVPLGSPEHRAVEEFVHYGAPFEGVPGTITTTSGPPGLPHTSGPGNFTYMVASTAPSDRPDLEVRLLAADGSVLHSLDLVDVRVSHGIEGHGVWIAGRDRGGVLDMRFLINGGDRDAFRLTLGELVGTTPADVVPAMRMLADFVPGNSVVLAVRGGRPYGSQRWKVEESALTGHARQQVTVLEVLLVIQAHTYQRVVVPEPLSRKEFTRLLHLVRLLRGEQIEASWTHATLPIGVGGDLLSADGEFPLGVMEELSLRLGGRQILLEMYRRVLYCAARVADHAEVPAARGGDTIRLVPGSTNRAIITAVPAEEAISALSAQADAMPPTL